MKRRHAFMRGAASSARDQYYGERTIPEVHGDFISQAVSRHEDNDLQLFPEKVVKTRLS